MAYHYMNPQSSCQPSRICTPIKQLPGCLARCFVFFNTAAELQCDCFDCMQPSGA